MAMQLYAHELATTSRAVLALLEALHLEHRGLDVEVITVDLMRGEHHAPEYVAINPNRLIPALTDGEFVLTEASAILRFLASEAGSPLYPEDLRSRARVDERMAWFEANLYKDLGFQLVYTRLFPHHSRGSEAADAATCQWGREKTKQWLTVLNDHWIDEDGWVAGSQLTIADFFAASILSLAELIDFELGEYPKLYAWYRRVLRQEAWARTNTAYSEWVGRMKEAA